MKLRSVFILLMTLIVASCAPRGIIAERPVPTGAEIYYLDTGDQLRVTVFGQSDLSGEYTVDSTGAISVPLLPPIYARGLTADEFEAALEAELGARLLRNPNVSIQVTQFRPFYILGEVQNAGQYPYVSGMTVQNAAAIAGGFSYRANKDRITITRTRGDRIVELGVDSTAVVMPGDTILVKERFF